MPIYPGTATPGLTGIPASNRRWVFPVMTTSAGMILGASGSATAGQNGVACVLQTGATASSVARLVWSWNALSAFGLFAGTPAFGFRAYRLAGGATAGHVWSAQMGAGPWNNLNTVVGMGFRGDQGTVYAASVDVGGTEQTTNISAGLTLANWNDFYCAVVSGSVLFYANGILVATHATRVPSGDGTYQFPSFRVANDVGGVDHGWVFGQPALSW